MFINVKDNFKYPDSGYYSRGDTLKDISDRELELPDAVIGTLLKLAVEDKNVISLGPGEPDFVTPKPIRDYTKKIVDKATHYGAPQGNIELREAICRKLIKENKIKADPENVIVTCGSQEAIFVSLLTSLDVNEEIIVPNPSYLVYTPAVELVSGVHIFLELREDEDWRINPDRLKKLINKKKTHGIIINTPSNPLGTVLDRKLLEEIADIAVENELYIISDEAYEKLIYGKKHVSIGSLNGMNDYIVSLFTFSKSYAMCGYRLGYAVGPEKLITAMNKVSHYITLSAPTISQLAGVKALSISGKYVERMRKEYDRRRQFIVKRLNEIGLRTKMPYGAFYTFSSIKDVSKKNSYNFAKDLLNKSRVAVVPGTEFGKFGDGYIRCSYATEMSKIKIAMDRIEKFLRKN